MCTTAEVPSRSSRRWIFPAAVLSTAAAAVLAAALPALAGPSPQRTIRVRVARSGNPNGASGQPSLSADGRRVVFSSAATNLGTPDRNHARDVYGYEQGSGQLRLISAATDGSPADGPSGDPVISGDGTHVAFASEGTNLVAEDTNGVADVFAVGPDGRLGRASVATDGAQGDHRSGEPDLSADGRLLVFSSRATNLVAGDTNERSDVFVHDLETGATALVSANRDGAAANGDSSTPAISPDGRYVSFASRASDLVARDRNKLPDVFVRDLATGRTTLVSVGPRRRQQNAAVPRPFTQVSDISRNGRFVVFDSDGSNLVRGDRNRRTDVFLRDLRRQRTRRISLSTTNQEGGGDSFFPSVTPDGRYVAFQSLADNLVPDDVRGPDFFVRDVLRGTTIVADVTSTGGRRGRVRRRTLDRPALSDDASIVAFASPAANLVRRDRNRVADVFLRRTTPPASAAASTRVEVQGGQLLITFRSRDRHPSPLRCRLDGGPAILCPLGGLLLPRLTGGRHKLTALAGAPGSLYARRAIVIRVTMRRGRARVRVHNPTDV